MCGLLLGYGLVDIMKLIFCSGYSRCQANAGIGNERLDRSEVVGRYSGPAAELSICYGR